MNRINAQHLVRLQIRLENKVEDNHQHLFNHASWVRLWHYFHLRRWRQQWASRHIIRRGVWM